MSNVYRLPLPTPPVWRVKHTDPTGTRRELLVPARSNVQAMEHVEALLGPSLGGSCINTHTCNMTMTGGARV
jgi:hypothetical protein